MQQFRRYVVQWIKRFDSDTGHHVWDEQYFDNRKFAYAFLKTKDSDARIRTEYYEKNCDGFYEWDINYEEKEIFYDHDNDSFYT